MKDMIGYCGLDCESCDAYLATVNDDQALRERTAKVWAELNQAPILPEHINCEGCRMNGAKTVFCDRLCGIRQCAIKKGLQPVGIVKAWKPVRPWARFLRTIPTHSKIYGDNPEFDGVVRLLG